ncbi:uncharacterized protein PV09_02573 [Verruconis gallopava]|uniref:DNA polymerase epsilon subunit D n=1 Tax=Verruconis gallopava TaxID=253628 RepID=A0A0D2AJ19_9PEZI|nr:uncharacterized protein PV09_02573 [Verruconis gallopava]KIW06903.1 hypothetical protein PV09_02573 [Verruconis gallopava]
MPPRKSNVSQVSEDGGGSTSKDGYGVEDLALPRTMVQRLAKGVLPPNTQIQKDALLAISKSATVFVNYLSSHAQEQAQRMNKKTIQPKDVLDAIADIEFDMFLPRLEAELAKYNSVQCDKRNSYRRKVREEQKAKQVANTEQAGEADGTATAKAAASSAGKADGANGASRLVSPKRDDEEPRTKKVRGEDGMEIDDEEDMTDEPDAEDDQDEENDNEDDDDDDDDEGEDTFEDAKEELAEDPLEEHEARDEDMEDEALDEGNESD